MTCRCYTVYFNMAGRRILILSFIMFLMFSTFVVWYFSIPTYLQTYPYSHHRADISIGTKRGRKKRFYRFLMYSTEKQVSVETKGFIFKNCNLTFPRFQGNETKLEIFSQRLAHLRECVHGWDVVVFNVHELSLIHI